MTIRQQGGVFGRNPTFNDVEAQTIEATDISLPDNGEASFGATKDLKIYHDGSASYISETGTGNLFIDGGNLRLRNADGSKVFLLANSGDKTDIYFDGAVKIRTESTGAKILGNLSFNAGSGIDFSATSGTGTSELFDDYEEGTWTPVYLASTTNPTFSSYGLQSGYYTKVGEMVYVSARLRTNGYNSDGAGNLRIGGLPYASASIATLGSGGAISILGSFSFTSNPAAGYFISGGNYIQLNSNTLFTAATVSALGTGTADNDISFFGVYRAL